MWCLMNKENWMSRLGLYSTNQQLVSSTLFWTKRCKVMQLCCMSLGMLGIRLMIGLNSILRPVKNSLSSLLLAKRLVNIKIPKILRGFRIWTARILIEKNQKTKKNLCIMMIILENNLKKKNNLNIKKILTNRKIKNILER